MRFIKLLINIYISKSLMAYHQLLFAPIPLILRPLWVNGAGQFLRWGPAPLKRLGWRFLAQVRVVNGAGQWGQRCRSVW